MKRAPKSLWILIAFLSFAGILEATLPQVVIGTWTSAASLTQPRSSASAVLLADGRILFTGGDGASGPLQSAEFFATDGTVSSAAAMNVARSRHFAMALGDGRVLVGGGISNGGGTTNSAEIYDPSSDTWSPTNPLTQARAGASAAVLQDGRVLVVGGDSAGTPSNTIEIFDPATGNFSFAGTLSSARTKQAIALLQDGRVLIVGGFDGNNALASSDIFDPSSGNVTAGPSLASPRYAHTATTLINGQVLVIGGTSDGTTDLASAEVYDPSTGGFQSASVGLVTAREGHQAFLLPNNNNVLIVGGTSGGQAVAASELFTPQVSPADGSWSYAVAPTGSNVTPRSAAVGSAMQQDGLLLVAGGSDASGNALASTELYAFPTVKTDQADYAPGSIVTITGSGWQPGETVTLTLVESPLIDTHPQMTAVADANGNISNNQFSPDIHDISVRFYLSSVGSQSGLQALNTFTDAAQVNTTVTSNNNPSVVGQSVTLTATATQQGNGNPITCGSIQFKDGVANLGSAQTLNNVSNQVSITTTTLTQGSHNITAVYSDPTKCGGGQGNTNGANTALVQLVAGTATKLGFAQQPSNTAAGQSITPAVTVEVQDSNGTRVNTSVASITVAIGNNPSSGTLSGTTTLNAVNGTATFSNLSINNAGNGYTLTASGALTGATSTAFNITAGTATQLTFGQQPTTTAAGAAITPPVTLQVKDANGNVVTGSTAAVTIAIGTNPSSGTLSGTMTVNAVNGVATFSNLSIDKAGTGYTLTASSTGLTGATSNAFNMTVGAANKLVFSQQPTNTAATQSITPAVTVQVQDAGGNLVATSTASITVAIGTNPASGTLSGTKTVSAVNGVATFNNLSIDKVGTGYTLTASSAGLTGATSNAFNIAAGTATQLLFIQQPTNTVAGSSITPAVTAQVQDAGGNPVTTSTASITVAIGTNPSSGTLSGTKTVSAVNGVATFNNLSIDKAGNGYTLTAGATGLNTATSTGLNITAGALHHFSISTISSPQTAGAAFNITITAQDANNNTDTTFTANGNKINLSSTGTLVYTNPSPAFVNGVLANQSVSITNTGSFTITATGTGNNSGITGTSNSFTVNPGAANKLVFAQQPSLTQAGNAISPAVTVNVEDQFGNVVASDSSNVSIAISGPGVLSGTSTTTVPAASGVATFSNLVPTKVGNGFTLSATDGALTGATSGAFNVTAGAANKLAFSTPPSASASAGAAFAQQPVVTVQDQFGNTATGSSAPLLLAITSGTGTAGAVLACATNPVVASAGLASFSGCIINLAGSGYTLTASSSGLTSATSTAINVSARSVSVTATLTPSSVTTGSSSSVGVTVADTAGAGSSTPGGTIAFSSSDATDTFTSTSCTLSAGSCSVSVTTHQLGGGSRTITATYTPTDNIHSGNSGNANLTVTGTPPSITSAASTTFTAGSPGSFNVTTSGTPTPSLSEVGSLPTGVSFTDNGNGTATIAGTTNTAGNFPIMITAQNGITPNATQNFTLTVNPGSLKSLTLSPASATITAGGSQPYTATGFDQYGNSLGDVTAATTFTVTNGICTGNSCSSTVAGSQTVTGNDNGATGMATLNVMPGAITHLALTPATASINAGGSQTYTAMGLDFYNNPAGDVTSLTTFSVAPSGSCTGASCTSNVAGSDTVTGTYTNGSQGMATLTVNAGSFAQLQLLVPGETAAPGTATGKTGTPNVEYVNGPFNVTVNAVDQYFNVVNTAADTVHFASNDTDPNTKLPSDTPLASGTGTFSVTLETVSYSPVKTTITVSDVTPNTSIQSATSPALQVIIVYTASITPTMAGKGLATDYTLTINNAAAPNTNNLAGVEIDVPNADQGTIPAVPSVSVSTGNWHYDSTQMPAKMRFVENSSSDDVHPGGTITITFTATSSATIGTSPVSEIWTTTAFSDSAFTKSLPLALPEPTVQIGDAAKIAPPNTTNFTFGAPGTFTVTTTGVPTPSLSESGSLPGGVTFTDNGNGTATLAGTPGAAGTFPLVITAHNGFGPDDTQNFSLVVNKASQTITFGALANKTYGDPDFPVSATSDSGLAVSFAATGNCAISGSTVHITGAGSCTITASQAGDSNYNPATDVTQIFTIAKANQTISVTTHAPASAVYNTNFNVAATASSGLMVTYSSSGVCSNAGATFTMTSGTGTCTVQYDQAGNANYNPATQVTENVTAQKANQTITVSTHAPASAVYNTSFMVAATSSSNLAVAYSASGVCTNVGATFTMTSGTGTCTVQYDQAGDANYNPATQVSENVTAQKANQTITVTTHAPASAVYNTSFNVVATASSNLAVAYSASGVCTNVGATFTMTSGTGTCTVQYDQAGDANYNAATQVSENVTAQKANQTITVTTHAPASAVYNTSFNVIATASSGLTVTYSSSGVCSNAGATFTMTSGTGTCTVQYDQAGDANYNPATQVTENVLAQKANQTITFGALANKTYGDPDFLVSATSDSGLGVSFAVGASDNCTISGAMVHVTGAGSCTVTASQTGNNNYNAAPTVPHTFSIARANVTVMFSNTGPFTYNALQQAPTYAVNGVVNEVLTPSATATYSGTQFDSTAYSNANAPMHAGNYVQTVTFSGNNNYNPLNPSATQAFVINKANQTITFGVLGSKTYGDPDSVVSATSTSGLAVSFALGATDNCTIVGATVHITGAGNCTVTASQAGNNDYYAATPVARMFAIAKATLTVTGADKTKLLNAANPPFTVTYSGFVNGEGPAVLGGSLSCTTTATTTSPVGSYAITCSGQTSPNYMINYAPGTLKILYVSGGMCAGDVGHAIRQPINPDGTSVFKQKSTVPAKFAICDANAISIGTPGVVSSFRLVQTVSGTVVAAIDEAVDSTTPDTTFRWDPTAQQWIFNLNTKSLAANVTYFYVITLNDGSTIPFNFGLK